MVRGTEDLCNQIIKKVNQNYPEWKLNIKVDNDRFKYMQQQNNPRQNQPSNQYYQQHQHPQQQNRMNYDMNKEPQPNFYQRLNQPPIMPPQHHYQPHQNTNFEHRPNYYDRNSMNSRFPSDQNLSSNEPEKIVGEKHNRIFVREIWLGGIPQMCDKYYMEQLMSEFGMIENVEIFPKFAFIRFRMVDHATLAFERAERIYLMFGSPPGFKISFSDPSRRANIVGNHYEYDRQSPFLPILFLGFPPVTSALIDLDSMKSIVEKYGPIVNSYMRKNSNNQTRSYFLFTFDNLKLAIRAKSELNKRRDLLGDKRAEVTLLIDEEVIMRGRDLSHTERMYLGEMNAGDKKKSSVQKQFPLSTNNNNFRPKEVPSINNPPNIPPNVQPNIPSNIPSNIPFGGYHPPMHYGGYMMPNNSSQNYPPHDMYYRQPNYYPSKYPEGEYDRNTNVHDLIQSVLEKPSVERGVQNSTHQKKPVKNQNQESVSDIVNKMLGSNDKQEYQTEKDKERQPTWSGFMTWKGVKRIGVDGHTEFKEPQDYAINIMNLIDFKDIVMKEKATMIIEASSSIYEAQFRDFIKALRSKVGVSFTSNLLMYVMSKSKDSDDIKQMKQNQLLVIMQKTSLGSLIRDKLQKCEQLK